MEMMEKSEMRSPVFKNRSGVCGNKRVVWGSLIGFSLGAIIVGLAVGIPLSQRASDSETSVTAPGGSTASPGSSLYRAIQILKQYPLVDGHNDLAWQYRVKARNQVHDVNLNTDMRTSWNNCQTDIPRLQTGRVGAQFWSAFVPCKTKWKDSVRQTLDQIDTVKKFVRRYPDTFQFATSADEIMDAHTAGKVGSLLGVEGGHSIDSSLGNLRMFYDLGVRYMSLTHSCNTHWADNWSMDILNMTQFDGLSAFGETVVREMNRLGMMVDLSHTSIHTMKDVVVVTAAPVIFSQSSAFTICNDYRNVQDDVLQLVKTNKGLVMIAFYTGMINCPPNNKTTATLSQVADHIEYIKNLIGVDHVGIGSGFDGVESLPEGLEDVSKYPDLFAHLIDRGWSDEDLMKLAGKNLVRVFKAVEKVRDEMSNLVPYEDLIPDLPQIFCRTSF